MGIMDNLEEMTLGFGFEIGALPSAYLGIPRSIPFKSVMLWDGEERFEKN